MTIIYFLFIVQSTFAQENIFDLTKKPEERGDYYFNSLAYASAIESYERALIQNKSTSLVFRIAESYRLLNDPENAVIWYEKGFNDSINTNKYNEYCLHYADALSSTKQYAKAKEWYEKYRSIAPGDSRSDKKIRGMEDIKQFYNRTIHISVEKAPFNSTGSDFSPVYYGDGIAFVSSRDTKEPIQPIFDWDKSGFLNIFYYSEKDGVKKFSKKINSKYHEGPMVFYDNDRKIIYTRNNLRSNRVVSGNDGITRLKLYFAVKNEKEWSASIPLKLNSNDFSVGHPTLSGDGQTLYFASDMPGGRGGVDIYRSEFVNGEWQQPVNMGDKINTEGDEMFPYLFNDNELYFASNGHAGLGGMDLFGIDISSDIFDVVNLGAPINSNLDDFGILIDNSGQKGYFSSNREGSINNDDIYSFDSDIPLLQQGRIKGIIYHAGSEKMLPEATVQLLNEENEIVFESQADDKGSYIFSALSGRLYSVRVSLNGFLPQEAQVATVGGGYEWEKNIYLKKDLNFNLTGTITNKSNADPVDSVHISIIDNITGSDKRILYTSSDGKFVYKISDHELNDRISYQIKLEKKGFLSKLFVYNGELDKEGDIDMNETMDLSVDKIDLGTDLGKLVDVKPIYFDLGKFDIRDDAAIELDKIVQVMKANPNIHIELGSHTDSRGSMSVNLKLSEKRAKASADYIKSQGIRAERISGKGYGESMLINHCRDGEKCSEAEHQQNRRTEFKIISL